MEAFINYDIEGNEKLLAIFKEAGCASLFEYAKFFDRTNKQIKMQVLYLNICLLQDLKMNIKITIFPKPGLLMKS